MKKMVEIYSSGNEYYYYLDGKKRGGFSTKEKAKADAKEMNRARKARGEKKIVSGKVKNIRTGPIQQGATKLTDRKRELKKSEWFDLLKKKPSRRERKQRKYTYKVPKGVYTKPALRAKIHRRLWAKNTHGTGKYQWSGRKSQELNRLYQKAGGGFVNKK
jgi:hypothetical protein